MRVYDLRDSVCSRVSQEKVCKTFVGFSLCVAVYVREGEKGEQKLKVFEGFYSRRVRF